MSSKLLHGLGMILGSLLMILITPEVGIHILFWGIVAVVSFEGSYWILNKIRGD